MWEKEYKPALSTLLTTPAISSSTNPPANPLTNPPPAKPKNAFFEWLKDGEDEDLLEDEY
jgi:hypothetical protein